MTDLLKQLQYIAAIIFIIALAKPLQGQNLTFNPENTDYLWPTNASNALSGTFGETRSSHFHAALDIKTWGQRGYPVYATRDGKLHRMAINPNGYGKVLYLKHDDGSYSIYAHLLRFNEKLQQLADSIRFSDYSPSFDMIVDSLNIHFEQGEEIALSGASGIGPPHLHFELRTPDQEPFNPLLTNLNVRDTISPTFSGLAVIPLAMGSTIEEKNQRYIRRPPDRKSTFADFGTISTSGPVGLAVDIFDQANGVPNVYAVYRLSLSVNGREVFHSKVDQFSYAETDQLHLDRVYSLLETTGDAYQRLYIADGNTLSFYTTTGNNGKLDLPPGSHDIRIEAADFYGNKRQAKVTLNVLPDTSESGLTENDFITNYSEVINPDNWQWFNNWVNIPREDFRRLTLAPLFSSPFQPVYRENGENVSVNLAESSQFYFRISPTDYFVTRRVYPDEPAYIITPDDSAYVSFPAGTFYDTTSVALTKQRISGSTARLKIFPENMPVRRSFTISVKLDSVQRADTTLSLYRIQPGSDTASLLSSSRQGKYLVASASSMGQFTLLRDTTAPAIGSPRIDKRPDGQWLINIPAEDVRSGIDHQKTKIYVNGVRGLAEYEAADDRLIYYHPDFVPQSTNTIRIVAFDNIGNRTEKEVALTF